jgi:predicted AAA+ superfamily ATPase
LDEIQEIKKFEDCIITLFEDRKINFDIIITGSNSKMFSDELATLFTGRHVEIKVYPFSFDEYNTYLESNKIDLGSRELKFQKFLQFGGLPILLESIDNDEIIKTKLIKIFDDVVNKDIKNRHSLRNSTEFMKIANFIFDNNGKRTSTSSITKSLQNFNKSKITEKTVNRYIS